MWGDFFYVGGNEKIFGCWGDSTHSPSRGNSDFITQFFLEILQRHCILILNTLGIPNHTNQKYYQFIDNCDARLHEKSTSFLTSFFRYYKDFVNLLFWVIWAGLAIPTKINGINLQNSLMLIYMQKKINFISTFFFEILQRFYKLSILVTLGMPYYDQ